jgi:hypothetical protein
MPKSTFDAVAKFIGNNDKKLISQALNGLDFAQQVRVIRNASLNGTGLQKMTIAKGIRNLNTDVNSRSGAHRAYTGRKLLVYPGMKIIDVIPEEVYNTFLSDMMAPGVKEIPFAQWLWENEFKKISQEINDNIYLSDYQGNAALFNGASVYAVNSYISFGTELDIYKCVTLTVAGESPLTAPAKWTLVNDSIISTGWGKIIANEIAGGGITGANLITTGALTNANAMDKVELMIDGMTVAHRNLGGTIRMSPVSYAKYLKQEKATFTAALDQKMGDGTKTVYGYPKWQLEQCSWMGTSSRLIATQKDNLAFGTNVESDLTKAGKVIETLHGYTTVVKWIQGCEIADLETLYVNDQA